MGCLDARRASSARMPSLRISGRIMSRCSRSRAAKASGARGSGSSPICSSLSRTAGIAWIAVSSVTSRSRMGAGILAGPMMPFQPPMP